MQNIKIGYQLYSARELVEKSMRNVLKELSALGYEGVEFAGFFGHSSEEINAMLKEFNLEAASSHVPVKDLRENLDSIIQFHKEIGCKHIVVPYIEKGERPGEEGFAGILRLIFEVGQKCRENGIQLLYHNHDFEFKKVSQMYGLDFIYTAVPEDLLKTEIDTCWVHYAGLDPVEYVKKYAGRAPVVHLKDYNGVKISGDPYALIGLDEESDKDESFAYAPFGHGVQNVKELLNAGKVAGAEWFVVEQDEPTENGPMADAKLSIESIINAR
ncbi:MAG: sugar phosphate isomerase/epimerase [Eubacteriales bacterium]|nr:sugar phosphate isomerase/epimerase [Eubacteriales bacterium]